MLDQTSLQFRKTLGLLLPCLVPVEKSLKSSGAVRVASHVFSFFRLIRIDARFNFGMGSSVLLKLAIQVYEYVFTDVKCILDQNDSFCRLSGGDCQLNL